MANPNQQFQRVIMPKVPHSRQNLSHTFKFTTDIGPIVPILCQEVMPGDVARVRSDVFLRFMPLVFPIMHEVDVYVHYFEVPWYLIFDKWPKFWIPQDNEGVDVEHGQVPIPLPQYFDPRDCGNQISLLQKGSLADYFGIPPVDAHSPQGGMDMSATHDLDLLLAPFIAYQLCYDHYYRDQHLQASIDFDYVRSLDGDIMNGDNQPLLYDLLTLRYRCWEKDLFTSSLPEPQAGSPQGILLDLASLVADVMLKDANSVDSNNYPAFVGRQIIDHQGEESTYSWDDAVNTIPSTPSVIEQLSDARGDNYLSADPSEYTTEPLFLNPHGSLEAKFNMNRPENQRGASFTVEQLRFAYSQQRFKEMLNVGGSRDTEVVRSQFNVIPDDLTIGRPRYLGGGKQNVVISEVLQQSKTDSSSLLGDFAGHGISIGSSNYFKARFKYFGFILGLMSIRPRSAYGQGVPKMFMKFDRYDFYWPHLSHLGEQPVLNGEVFWSWSDKKNHEEFGYQEIYHDYRFAPSRLACEMRDTLADWHMNRLFSSRPSLNADFVTIQPEDVNHVFAVPTGSDSYPYLHHIICEVFNTVDMIRPVPKYSLPIL